MDYSKTHTITIKAEQHQALQKIYQDLKKSEGTHIRIYDVMQILLNSQKMLTHWGAKNIDILEAFEGDFK